MLQRKILDDYLSDVENKDICSGYFRLLNMSKSSVKEYTAIFMDYREESKIKRLEYYKEIVKEIKLILGFG